MSSANDAPQQPVTGVTEFPVALTAVAQQIAPFSTAIRREISLQPYDPTKHVKTNSVLTIGGNVNGQVLLTIRAQLAGGSEHVPLKGYVYLPKGQKKVSSTLLEKHKWTLDVTLVNPRRLVAVLLGFDRQDLIVEMTLPSEDKLLDYLRRLVQGKVASHELLSYCHGTLIADSFDGVAGRKIGGKLLFAAPGCVLEEGKVAPELRDASFTSLIAASGKIEDSSKFPEFRLLRDGAVLKGISPNQLVPRDPNVLCMAPSSTKAEPYMHTHNFALAASTGLPISMAEGVTCSNDSKCYSKYHEMYKLLAGDLHTRLSMLAHAKSNPASAVMSARQTAPEGLVEDPVALLCDGTPISAVAESQTEVATGTGPGQASLGDDEDPMFYSLTQSAAGSDNEETLPKIVVKASIKPTPSAAREE